MLLLLFTCIKNIDGIQSLKKYLKLISCHIFNDLILVASYKSEVISNSPLKKKFCIILIFLTT